MIGDPSVVLGGAPQVSAGACSVALAGIVEVWLKVGQTARGFCARHRLTPKYSRPSYADLWKAPYADPWLSTNSPAPVVFVLSWRWRRFAMSETRKIAAILVADVVGYSRLAGGGRGSHPVAAAGPPQRPDRPRHRRASRPRRQAHRRRHSHRVPQRGRRGALRNRGAERHGRAQRRLAARAPHRVPRRHPSWRRRRGERRRPDGRWRQYRRAAGGHRQARRDLPLRGRLSPGEGAARSRGHRSRPDPTQEHRRADPGLFARSRRARPREARAGPSARKIRPAAPLDGRFAVRQYRRRPGAGAFRRRGHGEPHDRPFTDTRRSS